MTALEILKLALWNQDNTVPFNDNVYSDLKKHTVHVLVAPVLQRVSPSLSSDLYNTWQKEIFQQLAFYAKYKYIQSKLPITVPYLVLKGTSAAQYYPYPEYRLMGDIDIITRREDFDQAYKELLADGYREIKHLEREIGLVKNGIELELHHYFSSLNNIDAARYLDELIFENINPTHVLPDLINGLVLLEHFSKHLEGGIGLRQTIDWMMFVDKCLPDEKWPEFEQMAGKIGLDRLAIVATRMCEIYLGLPTRTWCCNADEDLCKQLMEYVLSCGNFGNKKTTDEAISKDVFAYASTPKAWFNLLQRQGLVNWKAAQKYKICRPFAWIYQVIRYIVKGLNRDNALSKLREEYKEAKKRNSMFSALGVNVAAKGKVVYRDGKYVKL